jgi:hypothetical protein
MKAETSLLPTEPDTHVQSKHWRECMLCEDYALTHSELQRFYALKEEANILFEQQERWDLIKSLYSEYFAQPPQVSGKEWMRLGFQGQYPETDFRGGGVLSLQLILRFVKKRKALVQQMESDKANFFFAITAINIAFFMKKYFHLADFLVAGKDIAIYCNRRALKNLCRILTDQEEAYLDMHDLFLTHFYTKLWLTAQKQNTETLLQFNALFDQLVVLIRRLFESQELLDYGDFQRVWEENTN